MYRYFGAAVVWTMRRVVMGLWGFTPAASTVAPRPLASLRIADDDGKGVEAAHIMSLGVGCAFIKSVEQSCQSPPLTCHVAVA